MANFIKTVTRNLTSAICLVLLCCTTFVHAQSYSEWSGLIDSNWNNAANWSMGGVPSSATEVVIQSSSNFPVITTTAFANKLHIVSGAKLEVTTTGTLTIQAIGVRAFHNDGTFTNFGNVVVNSDKDAIWNNGLFANNLGSTLTISSVNDGFTNYNGSLTNAGAISLNNNNTVEISFLSKGAFTNTSTGILRINNAPKIGFYIWSHEIYNQGTIEIGTTSTSSSTKGIFSFDGTLTNTGTIIVANSTAAYVQAGEKGKLINQGTFTAGTVGNPVEFITYQEYPIAGFINDTGGRLAGNGKIHSGVYKDQGGVLAPGNSPGVISFVGAKQLDNSIMELEVNGKTTAGTDFDQIAVNNAIMLGGELHLTINFPSPVDNDEVLLINATEIVGTFSSVTGLTPGWELKYNHPSAGKVSLRYSSSLPVKLTYFKAVPIENHVQLSWQTTHEENSDYFEIERSTDGKHWNILGRVSGLGNSHTTKDYTYLDTAPESDAHYYRLRMVDQDGKFEYSIIVSIRLSSQVFSVYPNPTNGTVTFSGKREAMKVYNLLGQQVAETKESDSQLDLSHLPSGTYLIRSASRINNNVIQVLKK